MKYIYNLEEPSFRVNDIDIQSVSRPENYKHSFRNGREKYGFIYVVNGKMLYSFSNAAVSELRFDAGDLFFVPKGCVYTGTYLEEGTTLRLIQFDLISGELPAYLSKPVKIEIPNAYELVESFFRPINNRVSRHPFYYLSRLYELLWWIEENGIGVPLKYKKLHPALLAIEENWRENKSIAYYAELCHMSEVSFRRSFREYTGLSPIDYRNAIRLSNSKSKLQSGAYNVSEAAYESGFSNLSFFIRLYKKKYGHTPKKE